MMSQQPRVYGIAVAAVAGMQTARPAPGAAAMVIAAAAAAAAAAAHSACHSRSAVSFDRLAAASALSSHDEANSAQGRG